MPSPSIPNTVDEALVTNYSGGNVFWVRGTNHGHGVGLDHPNHGTRTKPFATIDYAVGQCTANQGDIIMVMPGYVQTTIATGGITFDVAGVRVIGLGNANDRPTITYGTDAAADISITAADVVIENFIHIATIADVTGAIRVTGLGTTFLNHSFRDSGSGHFDGVFDIAGADRDCDYLTIKNCSYVSPDTQAFNFIEIANDVHYLVMEDCVHWSHATATVEFMSIAAGASLFGARLQRIYTHNLDIASSISLIDYGDQTDQTGVIADCFCNTRDEAGELLISGAANSFQFLRCRGSSVIDTQGYTLPTIDAID